MQLGIKIILVAFLASCIKKTTDSKACTEEARSGITVYVKDSKTNLFLSDSVTVLAVDGAYTETLMSFGSNPNSFSGAFERAGNYQVTATKRNYKSSAQNVSVTKDDCHVISQTLTLSLQAN